MCIEVFKCFVKFFGKVDILEHLGVARRVRNYQSRRGRRDWNISAWHAELEMINLGVLAEIGTVSHLVFKISRLASRDLLSYTLRLISVISYQLLVN
jgi:hypothetical protein